MERGALVIGRGALVMEGGVLVMERGALAIGRVHCHTLSMLSVACLLYGFCH